MTWVDYQLWAIIGLSVANQKVVVVAIHFTSPSNFSILTFQNTSKATPRTRTTPNHTMSTTTSPFLTKLPPELRLQIYESVLSQDNNEIQLTYLESSHKLVRIRPLPLGPLTCLNLFLVSHQIRSESLPLFTSTNTLKITTPILGNMYKPTNPLRHLLTKYCRPIPQTHRRSTPPLRKPGSSPRHSEALVLDEG